MIDNPANTDPVELAKFEALASRWWDPTSEFKPLHDINPLRVGYIAGRIQPANAEIVDLGCGGGLLTEALAARGARMTGLDAGAAAISVARLHQMESGARIDYRNETAEDYVVDNQGRFDAVTCMELLEHVPDPASTMAVCAQLVKPGGSVFVSTINRNPKSYLLAIIGAEYLLKMLPRGTHNYRNFIRPSELAAWARAAGLRLDDLIGMTYNPLTRRYRLGPDTDVNYIAHFLRD